MASALLSTSRFLPLQKREVSGLGRNFRSSFYGKVMYNRNCVRMKTASSQGGRAVVASVNKQKETMGLSFLENYSEELGRRVKNKGTVIPDPDYRIPVVLLGLAGGLAYTNNLLPAAPIGLLGLLLLFQTTRVRFVFDEEALEVKVGEQLQNSGENVFVGGKNRWNYSTFVNWELWWPNFPILVYFKETQTKPDGQVHFFPVIFNGKQLYDVMVERAGPSKNSGPK